MQGVSNHSSLALVCFLALDKDLCCSHALDELTSVHSSFRETNKIVNMQADKYINQSACCWVVWPGKKKREEKEKYAF